MRIISKFKDYYDSAASYGVDLELVYERNSKIEPVDLNSFSLRKNENYPFPVLNNNDVHGSGNTRLFLEIIGFCGSMFPVLRVSEPGSSKEKLFYKLDDVTKEWDSWGLREKNWFNQTENKFDASSKEGISKFFEYKFPELRPLFEKYHSPVFIYRVKKYSWSIKDLEIELNPSLSSMEFFKIKDAPSAFQEIFMFLAGVLGRVEKDVVNISDKDKIQQHGFDKWSFRKLPSKK